MLKTGRFSVLQVNRHVNQEVNQKVKMNATISIICYKQKTLTNGEHPLMIRVNKDGKRKYKSIGVSVKPENWDFKKNRPKATCPNKDLILKIIFFNAQIDFFSLIEALLNVFCLCFRLFSPLNALKQRQNSSQNSPL